MKAGYLGGAFLILFLLGCHSANTLGEIDSGQIVVNQSNDRHWYHATIELTKSDFEINHQYGFVDESGQFELFLDPSSLQVQTPSCDRGITLRMPATISDNPEREQAVQSKQKVFERLYELEQGDRNAVRIVVEFNPYVEVVSDTPLKLKLTRCNLFFRSSQGQYIDHTGSL